MTKAKAGTNRKSTGQSAEAARPPLNSAARRRVTQRKKQQLARKLRRFEAVLPAVKLPDVRPALPVIDWARPLRWLARARLLWISLAVAAALCDGDTIDRADLPEEPGRPSAVSDDAEALRDHLARWIERDDDDA